jgi:ubiquinone/menaquinone biosynthesis C-methylase UbiE
MNDNSIKWRKIWENNSRGAIGDFELDRGMSPRDNEVETLSDREHVHFMEPGESEVVLDAGCGTGMNILRLHTLVRKIIGIDYAFASVERCRTKIEAHQIQNAYIALGNITAIPLPDRSVNRILCLSVLQYLNDEEVRQVLREFVRVLCTRGVIILHVKNASSLYWSTLWLAKQLKAFLGWTTGTYYLRSFRWYVNELTSLNCRILNYKSFNVLTVEFMPKYLVCCLQRFELRHHTSWLFRLPFVRRHGADLKIKAVVDRSQGYPVTI